MVFKVKGKVLTKEEMAVKQAKKDVANQKVQAEAKALADAEKKKQAIKEAEAKSLADAEKKKQAIKEAELAVESKTTKKKSSL